MWVLSRSNDDEQVAINQQKGLSGVLTASKGVGEDVEGNQQDKTKSESEQNAWRSECDLPAETNGDGGEQCGGDGTR